MSVVIAAIAFASAHRVCADVVMLGYWPPTNEMLRPWSTNPLQNPAGWQGQNWGGLGHDVYSYFPEFPPDGDPTNDPGGSLGRVGSVGSDFQVDYQDTSFDFWRIMDQHNPVAVITFSWGGGDRRWEIEAVEGGHSGGGSNPAFDWVSDAYGSATHPTQATIDGRSWNAISTYRNGSRLSTQLPVQDILDATTGFGFANVFVDQNTSGNYLSGFMGLHGLYYNSITVDNLAAGHIHVGSGLSVTQATMLTEATLAAVLVDINRQIPEPSTLLLTAAALAIILTRRRQRHAGVTPTPVR